VKHAFPMRILRGALLAIILLLPGLAFAQLLPVQVSAKGNVATAQIGLTPLLPIADLTFTFDDASNLSAGSLGLTARLLGATEARALRPRLGNEGLLQLDEALPLLLTVNAPASGGLRFRRTGGFELHTHLLPYSPGSNLRVFKAPIGGRFEDVTEEIARGSVRARSRYGGFSQFLVLVDLRPTSAVVAEKIQRLRTRVATLAEAERPAFDASLDAIEAAVASADYASAIANTDRVAARALERAGNGLADEWRATRDADNQAGDLIAGAATLKFSLAYLRDYGN